MKNSKELIDDYRHGSLDENGQAELRAWLKQDPANMRCFTREIMFEEQIRAAIHAKEFGAALHSVKRSATSADHATPGNVVPLPRRLLRKLPALAAAVAAVVVLGLSFWHFTAPPTAGIPVALDSRWILLPDADAVYRILEPNRVQLLHGELRFTSLEPASLVVETPVATATAQGTDFFIGTHAAEANKTRQPDKQETNEEMKSQLNHLTKLIVLSGMVTLANAHGVATSTADNLLLAEAEKAPYNRAEGSHVLMGLNAEVIPTTEGFEPDSADKPGDAKDDGNLVQSKGIEMIEVEGGQLPHSSDIRPRDVAGFQIGKTEVTWSQWKVVRDAAKGYDLADIGKSEGENHPVTHVSWYDALKWCNAASEAAGLTPVYTVNGQVYRSGQSVPHWNPNANGYRLPSEAEWEFACRGGTRSRGFKYSGSNNLDEVGWIYKNSGYSTKPVAGKSANELGLHDMSGNVWEWCWDVRHARDSNRQIRGGGWNISEAGCAVSYRAYAGYPHGRDSGHGFRLARSSGN